MQTPDVLNQVPTSLRVGLCFYYGCWSLKFGLILFWLNGLLFLGEWVTDNLGLQEGILDGWLGLGRVALANLIWKIILSTHCIVSKEGALFLARLLCVNNNLFDRGFYVRFGNWLPDLVRLKWLSLRMLWFDLGVAPIYRRDVVTGIISLVLIFYLKSILGNPCRLLPVHRKKR